MQDDLVEFGETMRTSDSRGSRILKIALVALICVTALFFVHLALDYEIENGLRESNEVGLEGLPDWLTEEDFNALTGQNMTAPTDPDSPDSQSTGSGAGTDADQDDDGSGTVDTDDTGTDAVDDIGTDAVDDMGTGTAEDAQNTADTGSGDGIPTAQQLEEAAAAGISGWGFYYNQLTADEQADYLAICSAFDQGQYTEIILPAELTDQQLARIHYAVKYDHPEYFWMGEYIVYYTDGLRTAVNKYSVKNSTDDIPQVSEQLRAAADEILAGLPAGAGEYEKSRYLYEQIITRTDYVKPSPDDQNIKSVLLNHASVCTGYAQTYQYLANQCGLKVTTVCGNTDESHAWSLQLIGDTPYWTDVTYGDPINEDGTPGSQLLYDYLCVPDKLVSKHVIQNEPAFSYPSCTDGSLFYYADGAVVLDPYSAETAVEAVAAAADAGTDALSAGEKAEVHFMFNYRQDFDRMLMDQADRNSGLWSSMSERLLAHPVLSATGYSGEYQYQDEPMHITFDFYRQ